jgi:tRNA pseudouridine38-40 synthase
MQGIALGVAYQGTHFHGFAPQPGIRTVYSALLTAVQSMGADVTEMRGLSRTDSGVHARAQVVAFDTAQIIAPRGWVLGLNHHLPDDLAVRSARIVPAGFNPRFASLGKRYVYSLLQDPLPDPLLGPSTWHVHQHFDDALARAELEAAIGTHDFSAFRSASDTRPSAVRTIVRSSVTRNASDPRCVHLEVEGTAFLHNMVRILAGTAVDVALGRKKPGTLALALASGQRQDAGRTAPPQGLLLAASDVAWPDDTGEMWPASA